MVGGKRNPYGLRLRGAFFLLLGYAYLRFADAIGVEESRTTGTAFCGRSVGQKNHPGPLIRWAAVRKCISPNGDRINPLAGYRDKYKPADKGRLGEKVPGAELLKTRC